jgi:hypothetical protein
MGADHPIAWCQQIDRGRSWYTAMGHTAESYAEPLCSICWVGLKAPPALPATAGLSLHPFQRVMSKDPHRDQ